MRLPLSFILISFSLSLTAQISLRGRIAHLPSGAEVVVEPWYGDRWQQGDLLPLGSDGAFSVYVESAAVGQYRLRVLNQTGKWTDFIWPAPSVGDSILTFHLDFNTLDGGPAQMTDSRENEAYTALRLGHQKLSRIREKNPDAKTEAAAVAEFNGRCVDAKRRFSGTYSADIVANLLYEPRPEDYPPDTSARQGAAFQRAHTLDKVPFRSAGVLRHNGLVQALNRFYLSLDRGPEAGRQFIDGVMIRRQGNEEVDGFLFNFLLGRMLDANNEPGLSHLLTHYPPDCSDESPLPDGTKNLIQALQTCAPGQAAPEIQLPGPDGRMLSLADVCARNKITLIFIWRTNCPHCEEFAPVLADIYKRYHPLGLAVYAVSLDREETEWMNHLQQHPAPWLQVFVPDDRRRDFSRQFPVPGTPTLISLDSTRRVLSRLLARQTLEAYLKEELKKR